MRRLPALPAAVSAGFCGLLLTQCDAARPPVPSPVTVDASEAEPQVRSLFERLVQEARNAPDDAAARGRLGMAYEANDLLNAAAATYEQAIALDPGSARWPYLAAVTAATQGDLARAVALVDAAIAVDGEYGPAHWRRGHWLFALGQLDAAAGAYRRATDLRPNHPAGWLGIARVHLQRDENQDAADVLEAAIARRPQGAFAPYLRQLLGVAYRNLGRLDEARVELARGLAGPPTWSDEWHDEISQYRVSTIETIRRAQQLIEAGRGEEAIPMLEELRPRALNSATLLESLGVAYLRVGRFADARRTLEELVRLAPDRASSHLNLSASLQAVGATGEALAASDAALEIQPDHGAVHRQRGVLLESMQRDEEALAAFARAVEIDPTDVLSLGKAAEIAARLGHTERAIEFARRARELDPSDVRARRILDRTEGVVGP